MLEAARKLGVDLDSRLRRPRQSAGAARSRSAKARSPSTASSRAPTTSPRWNAVEARYVGKRGAWPSGRRLGCQAKVTGDLVIDVPPDSQVHRQVVRKARRGARHRASIRSCACIMSRSREPDMHDPSSDFRRLQEALDAQWRIEDVTATSGRCRAAEDAAPGRVDGHRRRAHDGARNRRASGPACTSGRYGLAVDIGSTTIAAHLCDLSPARWSRPPGS